MGAADRKAAGMFPATPDELKRRYAESTRDKALEADPVFCWTQYAGTDPARNSLATPEVALLEIGCGTGRALAFLLKQGVQVTGARTCRPWRSKQPSRTLGAEGRGIHLCAEVLEHLAANTETYDAIYSIFGAALVHRPGQLLPSIARRLNPGGALAFSQPPAIPGAYGPQGMYKGGFAGKAMFTYRYSYTPRKWTALLTRSGSGISRRLSWTHRPRGTSEH